MVFEALGCVVGKPKCAVCAVVLSLQRTAVCEKNISKILPKIQKHFVISRHRVNHTRMPSLPGLDRSQIT
ncbi:MAG: hypothetical protein K1X26_09680, partial [Chitinophagales bacterium]|nr:hypothetical protein [Chitinophagales bacterium]